MMHVNIIYINEFFLEAKDLCIITNRRLLELHLTIRPKRKLKDAALLNAMEQPTRSSFGRRVISRRSQRTLVASSYRTLLVGYKTFSSYIIQDKRLASDICYFKI